MRITTLPSCAALFLAALLPSVANAQETPATVEVAPAPAPRTVTTQETTSQATGPSWAMVGSGLTIFGLSYLPVVVVGAESGLDADRALFVPLAGPWIDLVERPGCAPGTSCNVETTNKVLLVVDGLLQGVGALTVLGGLLDSGAQDEDRHEDRGPRADAPLLARAAEQEWIRNGRAR
jgi:hypothetical protein